MSNIANIKKRIDQKLNRIQGNLAAKKRSSTDFSMLALQSLNLLSKSQDRKKIQKETDRFMEKEGFAKTRLKDGTVGYKIERKNNKGDIVTSFLNVAEAKAAKLSYDSDLKQKPGEVTNLLLDNNRFDIEQKNNEPIVDASLEDNPMLTIGSDKPKELNIFQQIKGRFSKPKLQDNQQEFNLPDNQVNTFTTGSEDSTEDLIESTQNLKNNIFENDPNFARPKVEVESEDEFYNPEVDITQSSPLEKLNTFEMDATNRYKIEYTNKEDYDRIEDNFEDRYSDANIIDTFTGKEVPSSQWNSPEIKAAINKEFVQTSKKGPSPNRESGLYPDMFDEKGNINPSQYYSYVNQYLDSGYRGTGEDIFGGSRDDVVGNNRANDIAVSKASILRDKQIEGKNMKVDLGGDEPGFFKKNRPFKSIANKALNAIESIEYGDLGLANKINKGRKGDSDMRLVNGELSHVNPTEAFMIDNYGQLGENQVKAIGSGTTNPYTGEKEYFFDTMWKGTQALFGNNPYMASQISNVNTSPANTAVNIASTAASGGASAATVGPNLGAIGLGVSAIQMLSNAGKATSANKQQKNVIKGGIQDLKAQRDIQRDRYKEQFELMEDVEMQGLSDISKNVGQSLMDVKTQTDNLYSSSGSIDTGSREQTKNMLVNRTVDKGKTQQESLSFDSFMQEKQLGQNMSDEIRNINLTIEDMEDQLDYLRDYDEFHENLFG